MNLRPYQVEALDAVLAGRERGLRRMLVVLPTGAGKTVVFARLPAALGARRTLVLAHRRELLDQAAAKIRAANPELRVEVEQAERRATAGADVVVASVATVGRQGSSRLAALDPWTIDLVVIDEAHHAIAGGYRVVLEACTSATVVGVTATPDRGDGRGLDPVFEEIVYERQMPDLIELGYLTPIRAWRVDPGDDLSAVRSRGGDFVERDLAEVVNTPARNGLVVASYEAHAPGLRAVAFCADVAHAADLARAFRARGHRAAHVHGAMPDAARAQVLEDFQAGTVRVVTNCAVLTEGFDCPAIACVLMARPTRSGALYRQCVGRGTRPSPGKDHLTLIDFGDRDHRLVGAATLYGVRADAIEGEDLRRVAIRAREEAERQAAEAAEVVSQDEARRRSLAVDMFAELATATAAARRYSRFAWVAVGDEVFSLSIDRGERLEVRGDRGRWLVYHHAPGEVRGGNREFAALEQAIWVADGWLVRGMPERIGLLDAEANWRQAPASERQLALLERMRIEAPDALTKDEAQQLIEAAFARRREARRGRERVA